MTPESTGEAGAALAAFPRIADVTVIEHDACQAGQCLDLRGRSIEAMVLAGRISAAPGIRVSMADLFKAPTAGDTDRQLDQMADARK